jgi:hypothetical protein
VWGFYTNRRKVSILEVFLFLFVCFGKSKKKFASKMKLRPTAMAEAYNITYLWARDW